MVHSSIYKPDRFLSQVQDMENMNTEIAVLVPGLSVMLVSPIHQRLWSLSPLLSTPQVSDLLNDPFHERVPFSECLMSGRKIMECLFTNGLSVTKYTHMHPCGHAQIQRHHLFLQLYAKYICPVPGKVKRKKKE